MKKLIIRTLATTGGLALFFAVGWAFRQVADYESIARRLFENKQALDAIEKLYARVEASPSDASLKVVYDRATPNGKVRLVPKNWLPEPLSEWGRQTNDKDDMAIWGDVIAYYDSTDELIGIAFSISRYGCFASRDPMRCPPWFTTLHRIRDGTLFVAIRVES